MYLENDRIRLRAPEPEDLEKYYIWENDTSLWVSGDAHLPYSRFDLKKLISSDDAKDFYSSKQIRFTIEQKSDNEAVGAMDLFDFSPFHKRAAVGALVDSAHRKKGYAAEAMGLLCDYALRFLKLHQVYAYVPEHNTASINMLERCGFTKQGLLPDWLQSENGYDSVYILSLLNRAD